MITRHQYAGNSWIELTSPTEQELRDIGNEYNLNPEILYRLESPSPKSSFERLGNSILLTLHFPIFSRKEGKGGIKQEIDLVIHENIVITTTYDSVESLRKLAKQLEVSGILHQPQHTDGVNQLLFFVMLKQLYGFLFDEMYFIEDWIEEIEERIFVGEERTMLTSLSRASRTILDFNKTISFHKDILNTLCEEGKSLYGEKFALKCQILKNDYSKVSQMLRNLTSSIRELRETNNSLLTTKQNEVVQILTIMTFILFPLTLIAGIFGMNVQYMPIVGTTHDFWDIIGIMVVVSIVMYFFFKWKKLI